MNLKSAFFLSQTVAREQIPKGGGKHIHISSVRSLLGIHRGFIGYCTSKGGMNLMIKQLATEWAKHNINVNGIAPTFIRTELVKQYLEDPNFYNPLVARIPMGRVGEPLDLAGLAFGDLSFRGFLLVSLLTSTRPLRRSRGFSSSMI